MKYIVVDPPSGWRYGFPKRRPPGLNNEDFIPWLIKEGYPKEEIDRLGDSFYCRFWEEDDSLIPT